MKCAEAYIKFEEQSLSLETTAYILEKIVGHFLYCRGQIEQPYDQLKDDENREVQSNSAATHREQLNYCERSTPFKEKGNFLFATPLNFDCETPVNDCVELSLDTLTESIHKFSINSEVPEDNIRNNTRSHPNEPFIAETPVTTRLHSNTTNKRRVLGKLQMVSVPITPKQTYNIKKHCNQLQYLFDFNNELKSHIMIGWEIKQIIILMGNTIVSPRELYVIDMAALQSDKSTNEYTNKDTICNEHRKYALKVMQTLFINPFLDSLPVALPMTNSFLMLQVAKASAMESPSTFFEPKLRFSLPKRGSRFTLNLSNSDRVISESKSIYMAAPRPFRGSSVVSNALKKPSRDLLDTIE